MNDITQMRMDQQLIGALRAVGTEEAAARADALQTRYHDLQMAKLGTDVYDAAAGEGKASAGWKRASEDPASLAQVASQMGTDVPALKELLQPRNSGFRAEIYLPDPAILGPGFKPVIAFKGSAGEVLQADGTRRDTTLEDFGANNFPQSIGQETDYYNRAMRLALVVRRSGFDCEGAAHSLGGGTSSAFSAISGRPSTTFNAAGLHPETTARFARQNPGVEVHDVSRSVRAYEVSGELLNAGIQDNIRSLDAARRERIGEILQSMSVLLRKMPDAQRLLDAQLEKSQMPDHAREAVLGFFDTLATGNVDRMLKDMPQAAGMRQPPLPAMALRDGAIVDRDAVLGLSGITRLADPILQVAKTAGQSAEVGQRIGAVEGAFVTGIGQAARQHGAVTAASHMIAGEIVRQTTLKGGEIAVATVEVGGRALAAGREHVGELEARLDDVQGDVQARAAQAGAGVLRSLSGHLPDGLKRATRDAADGLEQSGAQARQSQLGQAGAARADARADAAAIRSDARALERQVAINSHDAADLQRHVVVSPGRQYAQGTAVAADVAKGVADHVPTLQAAQWGAFGGLVEGTRQFANGPAGLLRQAQAAAAAGATIDGAGETVEKHLMAKAVLPSMEAQLDKARSEARDWLKHHSRAEPQAETAAPAEARRAAPSGTQAAAVSPSTDPSDQAHPDHGAYRQIRAVVTDAGRWNAVQSANISAALLARFKADAPGAPLGMAVVGRPFDNGDVNVFAVTAFAGPGGGQRVAVGAQEAAAVPAEQSFARVEQVNQQQVLAQQQSQQISIDAPSRRGPVMS